VSSFGHLIAVIRSPAAAAFPALRAPAKFLARPSSISREGNVLGNHVSVEAVALLTVTGIHK